MHGLPVDLRLLSEKNESTGKVELVIEVRNAMDDDIDKLSVDWCFDYHDHIEAFKKIGSVTEFIQVGEGPLRSGETRQFVFPPERFPALLSVVDALSSERYYICVEVDGISARAIDGRTFGDWVQRELG